VDLSQIHLVIRNEDRDLLEDKSCQANLLKLLRKYLLDTSTEDDRGRPFPAARQLKANYTPEELRHMNIDFERLLEIDLLLTLPKSRPFTKKEDSLLKKATRILDCHSSERRILRMILGAPKNPQEALETVKLIIKEEGLDMNSIYIGLRSSECGSSFLLEAAAVEQDKGLEFVRFFLDNGVDVNTLTDYGNYEAYGIDTPSRNTALHYAAREGNIEIVRLLLDRRANVNMRSSNGLTPLHLALRYGFLDIARLLIDYGANRDIQDDEGKTPFDLAIEAREQMDDETEQMEFDEALSKLNLQTT
jgi:hypothetical protein